MSLSTHKYECTVCVPTFTWSETTGAGRPLMLFCHGTANEGPKPLSQREQSEPGVPGQGRQAPDEQLPGVRQASRCSPTCEGVGAFGARVSGFLSA